MIPKIYKLFRSDTHGGAESIEVLFKGRSFTLEHITSRGDSSDPHFWYEQDLDEWVALIAGTSTLDFESGSLELTTGDAILIPAKLKHRVAHTSQDAVWIALHFDS